VIFDDRFALFTFYLTHDDKPLVDLSVFHPCLPVIPFLCRVRVEPFPLFSVKPPPFFSFSILFFFPPDSHALHGIFFIQRLAVFAL